MNTEEILSLRRRRKLHETVAQRLKTLFGRASSTVHVQPEAYGATPGRADTIVFDELGRSIHVEIIASRSVVHRDLLNLEQSTAALKLVVLIDEKADARTVANYYSRRPTYPRFWISEILDKDFEESVIDGFGRLLEEVRRKPIALDPARMTRLYLQRHGELVESHLPRSYSLNDKKVQLHEMAHSGWRGMVFGQAGVGKTSVFIELLQGNQAGKHSLAPIYLDLKLSPAGDIVDLTRAQLTDLTGDTIDQEQVEPLLHDQKTLLFLDGLDEVPFGDRDKVCTQVELCSRLYPRPAMLVTSRVAEPRLLPSFGAAATLEPLSDDEVIGLFARKLQIEPAEFGSTWCSLDPGVRDLYRVPIMIELGSRAVAERGALPRDPVDVYSTYVEHSIERVSGELGQRFRVSPAVLMHLLERLALTLVESDRPLMQEADLERLVADLRTRQPLAHDLTTNELVDRLLRVGLLRRSQRSLLFWHQSLKDFLAGRALTVDKVRTIPLTARWRPSISFLGARLPNDQLADLVSIVRDDFVLACQCASRASAGDATSPPVDVYFRRLLAQLNHWQERMFPQLFPSEAGIDIGMSEDRSALLFYFRPADDEPIEEYTVAGNLWKAFPRRLVERSMSQWTTGGRLGTVQSLRRYPPEVRGVSFAVDLLKQKIEDWRLGLVSELTLYEVQEDYRALHGSRHRIADWYPSLESVDYDSLIARIGTELAESGSNSITWRCYPRNIDSSHLLEKLEFLRTAGLPFDKAVLPEGDIPPGGWIGSEYSNSRFAEYITAFFAVAIRSYQRLVDLYLLGLRDDMQTYRVLPATVLVRAVRDVENLDKSSLAWTLIPRTREGAEREIDFRFGNLEEVSSAAELLARESPELASMWVRSVVFEFHHPYALLKFVYGLIDHDLKRAIGSDTLRHLPQFTVG